MNKNLAKTLLQIRVFEETLLELFAQGRLQGTVHTCIGQELVAAAIIGQLVKSDWVFSNHRCHGHYLAWNGDQAGLLAEIMGLPVGICGGRGGSQHIFRDQFLSNGVQGGGIPIAAGCALKLKKDLQSQSIAVAFIGDGTLGQGVLYETMNLACKWDLPLLIVIEKNGYAQSTSTTATIAGDVRKRFDAFDWKCWEANIWNEQELFAAARDATRHVRNDRKPAVICVDCYRLKAHSKGDDNRSKEEISKFLERDPITVFAAEFPDEYRAIREECETKLRQIIAKFEAAEMPAPASPFSLPGVPETILSWRPVTQLTVKPERVVERLRKGLRQLLVADERVMIFGEDIEDPYGGAFKVTRGLSSDFVGRVCNTPISEAAMVGVGNGLALAGFRPIVEIMFGDFITLAADQLINQASKFAYMYNGQVSVPLIVRTAMGGKRGYGATHSQCLEKHFFGTPGLTVVCVNAVFDPAELLRRVHHYLDGPCLFVENKLAYSTVVHERAPDSRVWEENGQPLPTLRLSGGQAPDVTLVTYGGMLEECEEAAKLAFEQHEIAVELIVPTQVYPIDTSPIVESVRLTGKLLTVEEGQGFSGFGAEVLAICAEYAPGGRSARVFAAAHPIPCARGLEKNALPSLDSILNALLSLAKK